MKRWKALRGLWTPFTQSPAMVYGVCACYYILLSLLPGALLLGKLLPELPRTVLQVLLPRPLLPYALSLRRWASVGTSGTLLSAIMLLWSASRGILALSQGLDVVLDVASGSSYLRRRLRAMGLMFGLLCVCAGLPVIYRLTQHLLPKNLRAGWVAAGMYLWGFFVLLYRFLPRSHMNWKPCILGGLTAAAGWLAITWGFTAYSSIADVAHRASGRIGMLLFGCLWLQSCIVLVLYGAILARLMDMDAYHPWRILRTCF